MSHMNSTDMCANSFQKREIMAAELVREVSTNAVRIDLDLNNGWREMDSNATDKGDRAGIHKVGLGTGKNLRRGETMVES